MKALILDGAEALRDMADAAVASLRQQLEARGYSVTHHVLSELEIPACRGDFACWTATPGLCTQPGPHRDLARELIQSDLAIWLTPVAFGGYSSALKKILDHCIPLVSPLMTTVHGETHHVPRYARFPGVLAIGLMESRDIGEARVFERLVQRNALNVHTERCSSSVLTRGDLPALPALAARWLDELATPAALGGASATLPLAATRDRPATPPRRVLLLNGSPRGKASVSAAIAAHLEMLLSRRGVQATTTSVEARLREDPKLRELIREVQAADVVALAVPVYVDSLPAPVTRALEILARERRRAGCPRARFLAVVNCGFPEAVHTETALAICRGFTERANLAWIGGLGIGGGGMLAGKPLAQLGRRARFVTHALELTADAVARGQEVPDEAQQLVRQLPLPRWLYSRIADWGFRREALRHGALGRLGDRPDAR